MKHYTKEDIVRIVNEEDVEFIRLQFSDIFGQMKNVAVTRSQIEKVLDNKIMIDGSSIEGFTRIHESDQYLRPDLNTFAILPWQPAMHKTARLICDVYNPDGTPFVGDPRYVLKQTLRRAEEMGYTLDEVVILASMIEKEAKTFDFNKVSAVFYGRLANDMPLHSDATLGYVLKTQSMEFTQEELDIDNPYNTYKYKGLPAGPISNPGTAAMEAVLFPNEQYITEGYLYFCLMDPTTGALAFAKTAEEHAANVEKYKPLWGN